MSHDLILKNISRFINLDKKEVDFFISLLELKFFKKKEFVLQPGKVARSQIFVTKGCVKNYSIDNDGFEHIVMFAYASSFNQNIGSWDVSNVDTMYGMFWGATLFNQDIGSWNVSNVTTMYSMFSEAISFNKDIGSWDVSNVSDDIGMTSMFKEASSFNQDLSGWCVSNYTSEPNNFDFEATAWTNEAFRPVWGTCPN